MKINKIALAMSFTALSSISQATTVGMDLNGLASFVVDDFSTLATGSSQPYGPNGPAYPSITGQFTDMSGSSGSSGGGLMVTASTTVDAFMILTSGGDGSSDVSRLYDSGSSGSISLMAYAMAPGASTVNLVVSNRLTTSSGISNPNLIGAGSMTGQIYPTLLGQSIDTVGSNLITTYSFDLNQTLGSHKMFNVSFDVIGAHKSIDAIGLVTNASTVPVPAAAWLFGSALLGLAGLRKNK